VKSSLSEDSSNYGTFASLNPDFSLGEANNEIARTAHLVNSMMMAISPTTL
jgi:hypothetical protein